MPGTDGCAFTNVATATGTGGAQSHVCVLVGSEQVMADPEERTDLASEPSSQRVLAQLQELVRNYRRTVSAT
jgi:hypothetical protein